MVRAFLAIELPLPILKALARQSDRLAEVLPPGTVRFVRPEGQHLTLKFFGEVPESKIPAMKEALAAGAAGQSPFRFSLAGFGCFPNPRRANVLWVGIVEPSGVLVRLYKELESSFAALGFPPEKRAFHPHVTLGRVRRGMPAATVERLSELLGTWSVPSLGEVEVDQVSLMRSVLNPSGAVYTRLGSTALGVTK